MMKLFCYFYHLQLIGIQNLRVWMVTMGSERLECQNSELRKFALASTVESSKEKGYLWMIYKIIS